MKVGKLDKSKNFTVNDAKNLATTTKTLQIHSFRFELTENVEFHSILDQILDFLTFTLGFY